MKKKLSMLVLSLVLLLSLSVPVYAAVEPLPSDTLISSQEDVGLLRAESGDDYDYVEDDSGGGSLFTVFLFGFVGPNLIALGVCFYMVTLNKTAVKKRAAHEYVNHNEVVVRIQEDHFTHQTRSVRKKNKS